MCISFDWVYIPQLKDKVFFLIVQKLFSLKDKCWDKKKDKCSFWFVHKRTLKRLDWQICVDPCEVLTRLHVETWISVVELTLWDLCVRPCCPQKNQQSWTDQTYIHGWKKQNKTKQMQASVTNKLIKIQCTEKDNELVVFGDLLSGKQTFVAHQNLQKKCFILF